jgi:hypothetical protein
LKIAGTYFLLFCSTIGCNVSGLGDSSANCYGECGRLSLKVNISIERDSNETGNISGCICQKTNCVLSVIREGEEGFVYKGIKTSAQVIRGEKVNQWKITYEYPGEIINYSIREFDLRIYNRDSLKIWVSSKYTIKYKTANSLAMQDWNIDIKDPKLNGEGKAECFSGNVPETINEEIKTVLVEKRLIDAKEDSYCYIDSENRVTCWGNSWNSQSKINGTFDSIDVGLNKACGIKKDKTISCWDNSIKYPWVPEGYFKNVSVLSNACGIRDNGAIICWDFENHQVKEYDGLYLKVEVAKNSICGIKEDFSTVCWNEYGIETLYPNGKAIDITSSNDEICIITSEHTPYCWSTYHYYVGSMVIGDKLLDLAANSWGGLCGININNYVVCWGGIYLERAGMYDKGNGLQIAEGDSSTCKIDENQKVSCWDNPLGSLSKIMK